MNFSKNAEENKKYLRKTVFSIRKIRGSHYIPIKGIIDYICYDSVCFIGCKDKICMYTLLTIHIITNRKRNKFVVVRDSDVFETMEQARTYAQILNTEEKVKKLKIKHEKAKLGINK